MNDVPRHDNGGLFVKPSGVPIDGVVETLFPPRTPRISSTFYEGAAVCP
jgi:hypothetical protein